MNDETTIDDPFDPRLDGESQPVLSASGRARRAAILAEALDRQRGRVVERRARRALLAMVVVVAGGVAIATIFDRTGARGVPSTGQVANGERAGGVIDAGTSAGLESPLRIVRASARSFRVEVIDAVEPVRIEVSRAGPTRALVGTTRLSPEPIDAAELAEALASLPSKASFVWTARGPIAETRPR